MDQKIRFYKDELLEQCSFFQEKIEKVLQDEESLNVVTSVMGRLLDGFREEGIITDETTDKCDICSNYAAYKGRNWNPG